MTKTIKKTLALILSIVMLMSVMPMSYSFAIDRDGFSFSKEGVITGYSGTNMDVVIPATLGTYNIVAVGDDNNQPFLGKKITSVTIADSIKTIGSGAFLNCTSLHTVVLGDGVETIDTTAFKGCKALSTVVIGKNVKDIKLNAFKDCNILDAEGSVVKYKGSKSQWEAINIADGNERLTGAKIVFNYGHDCTTGNHIIGEKVAANAADCLNDGNIEYYPCEVEGCGAKFADATGTTIIDNIVVPGGHKLTQTQYKAPTCAEEGNPEYWYCSECEKYFSTQQADAELESIVLEKTEDHAYKWVPKVAENCTDSGKKGHHYCEVCNSFFNHNYEKVTEESLFLAAKGHTEVAMEDVPASCTETGSTGGVMCSVCEAILVDPETTDMVAHVADEAVVENNVEATCETAGSYDSVVYCQNCDYVFSRETINVDAKGHLLKINPLNMNITKRPTCTETGIAREHCYRCENDIDVTLGAYGHREVAMEDVPATCTEAGLTGGVMCSVCETILVDPETTDMVAHVADEAVVENNVEATCETAGSYDTVVYCQNCDYEFSRVTTTVDAKGHLLKINPLNMNITKRPTCTETGIAREHCYRCENDIDVTLGAYGHAEVDIEAVESTCKINGSYGGKKCSRCDEVLVEPTQAPLAEHTRTEGMYEAPTCTVDGYRGRVVCSVCDEILVAGEVIPAAHDYAVTAEVAPGCTSSGSKTYTCQVDGCDATYTETIDPNGHTRPEEWNVIVEPTCTERGAKIKVCTVCGNVLTEVITALGHEFTTYISDEDATCTEDGFKTAICDRENCEATDTIADVGSALGHDFGETVPAEAATCLTEGNYAYKYCDECDKYFDGDAEENELVGVSSADHFIIEQLEHKYEGAIKSDGNGEDETHSFKCINGCNEYGDAESHSWDDGEETTAPECIEEGVMTYTCTVAGCGATYTEAIDALGHGFSDITEAADPTCIAEGNYAYKYCDECDMYFAADATVNSEDGEDSVDAFVIDQLDHEYEGAIKSDGDGENATHSFKCVNGCNEYGDAVAHTWNDGEVTTAPECTQDGVKTYTCTVAGCGATYTEAIDALGHEFGEITEAVEVTCLADGNEAYKFCEVCEMYFAGDAEEDSTAAEESADAFVIDQLEHEFAGEAFSNGDGEDETHSFMCVNGCEGYGATEPHSWNAGVINPAVTCTTDGLKTYTCTVDGCGATYTEVLVAPGHTFGAVTEAEDATCLEDGNEAYKKCSACNKYFADDADIYSTNAKNSPAAFAIEMLGHSFTEYESNEDATCLEDGTKTAICDRCDATNTIDDEDSALGHDFVIDEEVSKEVTCTEDGREKAECSRCDASYDNEYEAIGHYVISWVVSENATCAKEGLMIGRCLNCLKTIRKDIPVISHVDENKDKVCDNCGTALGTSEPENPAEPDDNTPTQPENPDDSEETVECSCYCHKSGILRLFLFDIPLLFQRLLGRNKVCKCGLVKHY